MNKQTNEQTDRQIDWLKEIKSNVDSLPVDKPASSHGKMAQTELHLVSVTKRVAIVQIKKSISIAL